MRHISSPRHGKGMKKGQARMSQPLSKILALALDRALHGRAYTRIGSIEEETYNHQDASARHRRHNPQGNSPTLKHRLNLLQPGSVNLMISTQPRES